MTTSVGLTMLVAAASAVGAVARYVVDQWVQSRHEQPFPWGTFVVNVSGTFLFALLVAAGSGHHIGTRAVLLGTVGFASGYTTWSTYVWESLALAENGALLQGALNVVGSVAAGLVAAAAGFGVGWLV
jgi:fluoride exporter